VNSWRSEKQNGINIDEKYDSIPVNSSSRELKAYSISLEILKISV
jgi:hypothetical protein